MSVCKSPSKSNSCSTDLHTGQDLALPDVNTRNELSVSEYFKCLGFPSDYDQAWHVDLNRPEANIRSFRRYADDLSAQIHAEKFPLSSRLKFLTTQITRPPGHATTATHDSDVVAVFECNHKEMPPPRASLELAVEAGFDEQAFEKSFVQTNYASKLLEARPDRHAILGLYMNTSGLVFILVGPWGTIKTTLVEWGHDRLPSLLSGLIVRLYDPLHSMVDHTIVRNILENDLCTWDIQLNLSPSSDFTGTRFGQLTCKGYTHIYGACGRTNVFQNNENPTTLNGIPIRIIKDQRPVPGVVELLHAEVLKGSDGVPLDSEGRCKVRLAEANTGRPFLEAKTPRTALMAIYDLLEITRYLFVEKRVLHRDISNGNVLISQAHLERVVVSTDIEGVNGPIAENSPSFIDGLLRGVSSTTTNTLIIDFDCGQVLDQKGDKARDERTGTPVFISRAVLDGQPLPLKRSVQVSPLPEPHPLYGHILPSRVRDFPTHKGPPIFVVPGTSSSGPFRHMLRHDAESVYILLLYWAIRVRPKHPQDAADTFIPMSFWSALASPSSGAKFTVFDNIDASILHPEYADLHHLLDEMGSQLIYDHHWAPEGPLTRPEYVHEAFQRSIFNFLVKHDQSPFMDLEVAERFRGVEGGPIVPELLTLLPTRTRTANVVSYPTGSSKNKRDRPETVEQDQPHTKKPRIS